MRIVNEGLRSFLAALDEPALLLTLSGVVRHANAPAMRFLGSPDEPPVGRRLADLAADPPESLATLLRRISGSAQSVLGSLQLRTPGGGTRRCRCRGSRLAPGGEAAEPVLLLRLQDATHDRFTVLTEKIVALNAEIRRNKRIQFQLETAVEQREMLLRELHHRVKNNLQTLLGILSIAERNTAAREAREAIRDTRARIEAMAVLQRLLYQRDYLANVDGLTFLTELCTTIERAFRRPGITLRVEPTGVTMDLDVASAAGLIVNELVTNAFKHAFPGREQGEITIRLQQDDGPGGDIVLVVEDNGRGLEEKPATGTGLMLIRGLAQQCGGTCLFESKGGVRCSIRLRGRPAPKSTPLH